MCTVELYLLSVLCCISLKACSKFVNNNEVTKLAKSSAKSPELLAKFCDTLLRKRYNLSSCVCLFVYQSKVIASYIFDVHVNLKGIKFLSMRLLSSMGV